MRISVIVDGCSRLIADGISARGRDRARCQGAPPGNWRRVKKGLPQRYRLFFMFASNPLAVVIYAWLNDEDTLRKEGSRTDVYEVFKRMLERGDVPSTINDLIEGSIAEKRKLSPTRSGPQRL